MRSAIAANTSDFASRRPATAGISAISRAIALSKCGSAIFAGFRIDGGSEIAAVLLQQPRGVAAVQSQSDQDGRLQVAIGLLEAPRGFSLRATDNLNQDRRCAAA